MFNVYRPIPQKLTNIKVKKKNIIYSKKCMKALKIANNLIKNNEGY